ncbi:MAG: DUF928 domain-containing protein [Oscillatoriaceae cyanobacterium]
MVWHKSPLHPILITIALSAGLVAIPASLSRAQNGADAPARSEIKAGWNSFEPPETGAPGRRVGGGTRSICPAEARGLTALVPQTNMGRTMSAHPTVILYVPALPTEMTVEFTVTAVSDDNYTPMSQQSFQTVGGSTIALPLPETETSLDVGQLYYWDFSIVCNPKDKSGNIVVGGWIERVAPTPTLTAELQNASPEKAFEIYSREYIWYDAAASLALLRLAAPDDTTLAYSWQALLTAVGLEDIANAPLATMTATPNNQSVAP